MFTLSCAVTIAFLSVQGVHAQAPAKNSVLSEKVNHLMNTHIGVENTVPPGWSIEAKPVASARGENDTIISQVHIFIHGAPEGTLFEQQSLPVGDDKPVSEISGNLGWQGWATPVRRQIAAAMRRRKQARRPNRVHRPVHKG
jgi:hypothetical protein